MGSAIGSLLLFLALVTLCKQRGKARRSLADISDNFTMVRPSKRETVLVSPSALQPPTSRSLQDKHSQIPRGRHSPPHRICDPGPHWQGQSDTVSELGRHALGRGSRRSMGAVSSTVGMLDGTLGGSPSWVVAEDTIYTRTPRESLVSTAVDTSAEAQAIPLAAGPRPTAAGVIPSLQKTIRELQMQVATLVRADEYEVSSDSSTKPPPPASIRSDEDTVSHWGTTT